MKRIHLIISGRVQEVGFRYFCSVQAARLRLTGYAHNKSDGTVEVEAQGEATAIEEFVQAVSLGPREANVTNVERDEQDVVRGESGFGR